MELPGNYNILTTSNLHGNRPVAPITMSNLTITADWKQTHAVIYAHTNPECFQQVCTHQTTEIPRDNTMTSDGDGWTTAGDDATISKEDSFRPPVRTAGVLAGSDRPRGQIEMKFTRGGIFLHKTQCWSCDTPCTMTQLEIHSWYYYDDYLILVMKPRIPQKCIWHCSSRA